MARVLFGVIPVLSHVYPTIAIAQRLQDQGHAVAYACHPIIAPVLQRAGLDLLDGFRWGDSILKFLHLLGTEQNRWMAIGHVIQRRLSHAGFDGLETGVAQLIALLRSWQPDVLVSDMLFRPGPIAAEVCHLPYATSCTIALPLPSATVPPYGFGLSPRGGPNWRWRLGAAVRLHWVERISDKIVNRVRQKYGLPSLARTCFHASPYLFLAYTTEALEYPRPDLPPQVYFVGPCISQRRGDTDVPFPWEWLDERPVVYVSFGTINTGQRHFFDKAIAASEGQPWQTIISLGRYLDPALRGGVPRNVLLQSYVPQAELLRRTRVMVSHAGANSVIESLAAGVPLIVAPIRHDQPENAQQVVEAGAGLRVNMRRVTVHELRMSIQCLLEDSTFRENAYRIMADFARCNGPNTAAALVLRLAETGAPLFRPPHHRPTVYADEATQDFSMAKPL